MARRPENWNNPRSEDRFPRHVGEVPRADVDYMAGQVKVDPALLSEYDWSGRSIERHRAQVREAPGFRESTRTDEDALAEWLADKICPMMFTDGGLRSALLARCRTLKIEPPGRVDRIARTGRARFEREFCLHVLNGLSADSARSLWELATGEDGFLLELKSDPARLTDADKRGMSPLFLVERQPVRDDRHRYGPPPP
ncbi:MAG: DUF4158 domain-containing protein [Streptosporangiaceae bacterium]